MGKDPNKRSPLKDPAMRNPGQSLAEARRRVWDDYGQTPALATASLVFLAMMKWIERWMDEATSPWLWTVLALMAFAWLVTRIFKAKPIIYALEQGEQGERAVGQYLERLREQGYQVFHDLIGDGFNLDHVIIGPAGIFSIETKTWSKPAQGEPKIVFNGEHLSLPGRNDERRPLIQAQAQASWLKTLLSESIGRSLDVRPVVLFPGWFIDSKQARQSPIWVLNPKALPTFLGNAPQRLSSEDIKLFSFHLSRWIRSEESRSLRL
ncbi:nuclease-related domain-containing protein [Wenzhouxiangella marina]|uniref:Uncharacterized protein n=1 Tax=Wenzhouxiangella marina TaxID=1579979 RepID=A0A0K0XZX2_9GAMM|nr:nuclease-related domain-containing protein [Wenzhouxiangella marina]AKS43205.1 hypothetical protein WM2015_2848 [Wenzhouxiangella marina]MBB6087109.1 hypothetical protein [Wenzhouxiangella marina]